MATILIVDDYRDTAETTAILLQQNGHTVHVASDGYQAIAIAQRQQPEFVLLDIGLPRMDGYRVASTLRRELGGRPPVIIAITGYGREDDRQKALAAGCDHHFVKPVDPIALVRLLSACNNKVDSPIHNGRSAEATGSDECPMLEHRQQVEIVNTDGLHLRAADKFVRMAQRFQASVQVACDGRKVNGRSILDLATLAAVCGTRLELETDGADAEAALNALTGLIQRGFDEEQPGPRSIVTGDPDAIPIDGIRAPMPNW